MTIAERLILLQAFPLLVLVGPGVFSGLESGLRFCFDEQVRAIRPPQAGMWRALTCEVFQDSGPGP